MISRRARLQISAFVVIALVGMAYVGAQYAGLGRLFGQNGYVVTVNLADSGGIFDNAEVTYLGVPVGRVGTVRLSQTGVAVPLNITSNVAIPSNVEAVVADRSAVGEQYVDLRPKTGGGPSLHNGSVIAQQSTETPLPVEDLMTNLDSLMNSVPQQSLRTVVDELGTAFQGNGGNLQTILDTTSEFTSAAEQNLPQTVQLINDSNTVLGTQNAQGSDIKSFSQSLLLLSQQMQTSDPNLRKVLSEGAPAAQQVSGLLQDTGQQLGLLLTNLTTTMQLVSAKKDGVEQVFVEYPGILDGAHTAVPGDGTAHFGLVLNAFDPLVCTSGYQGTTKRPGNDMTPVPANLNANCTEPRGSQTEVRGAQNAPQN